MLKREQSSYLGLAESISQRHLLFRSEEAPDKPWDSSRCTSILKKATTEVWKVSVKTQLYRQLTIGITEKHVQEIHKPFNRFDDKTAEADINVVFAYRNKDITQTLWHVHARRTRHILEPGSSSPDPELVSPRADEAKIALLTVAVDHTLDPCKETMQHTGRTLLSKKHTSHLPDSTTKTAMADIMWCLLGRSDIGQ